MSGRIAAYQEGYTDGYDDARKKYERPQVEWIPVSERLPEEEQDVLVCLIYNDKTYFAVTRLLNNKHWLCFSDVEVIAWQPLPEPYKKGGADMRKPNCVTCDHFGKCEGCEKGDEE